VWNPVPLRAVNALLVPPPLDAPNQAPLPPAAKTRLEWLTTVGSARHAGMTITTLASDDGCPAPDFSPPRAARALTRARSTALAGRFCSHPPCVFVSASGPPFLFRYSPSLLSSVFVPGFRSHFLKKSKSGVRGLHRDRRYCYGFPRTCRRQRGGFGGEHQSRPYVMTVASFGVCFSRTILPADGLLSDDEVLNVAGDGTCLRWTWPHVTQGSIFSPDGPYSDGDYPPIDRYHVYAIHGPESTGHRLRVCRCDQRSRGRGSQHPETHELLPDPLLYHIVDRSLPRVRRGGPDDQETLSRSGLL
jgi:hypothetical protein